MPGITVKKNENFSEWFTQVVSPEGANLADVRFGIAGFIVHMPWAMRIIRKIYDLLEDEVEQDGHEPYAFPIAIKEEYLKKEAEHAGFIPEVFWVETAGSKRIEERFALRPTGETQIYPMYALWLRTHKQLPFKGYASRHTVYRNEMTTRPFLRGREFLFFETHDMFATHEDALHQVKTDMEIMQRVYWEVLKLPHVFIIRPQWDKFMGADNTYVADTLMPDGKRNQMSSTHDLGTNFATPFGITFTDTDEQVKPPHQTCFGPGIWRIMAALIGIHGDDQGLILPTTVAPYHAVIIPIKVKNTEINAKVMQECLTLKDELRKYRVHMDTSDESPGWKFNQWEMKGVPLRIEVGPKDIEKEQVVVVARTRKEKHSVRRDDVQKKVFDLLRCVDNDIEESATKYFHDNTRFAPTLEEAISILNTHRGFVKVPFCSMEKDGNDCADIVKERSSGGNCCGIPWKDAEKPADDAQCIVCSKPAQIIMWVAKSY